MTVNLSSLQCLFWRISPDMDFINSSAACSIGYFFCRKSCLISHRFPAGKRLAYFFQPEQHSPLSLPVQSLPLHPASVQPPPLFLVVITGSPDAIASSVALLNGSYIVGSTKYISRCIELFYITLGIKKYYDVLDAAFFCNGFEFINVPLPIIRSLRFFSDFIRDAARRSVPGPFLSNPSPQRE